MAGRSRGTFEKAMRERAKRQKRQEKRQRKLERREDARERKECGDSDYIGAEPEGSEAINGPDTDEDDQDERSEPYRASPPPH